MIRHVYLFLLVALASISALGQQSCNVQYNFSDFTGSPSGVQQVSIQPLFKVTTSGTNIITGLCRIFPTTTNTSLVVSNILTGYGFRVLMGNMYTVPPFIVATFTNYFPSGTTGTVNAVSYIGPYTNTIGALIAGPGIIISNVLGGLQISSTGGSGGSSGTATNLDAGATNQVKTLALQVADPLGKAASLPINFIGVTNGDLRGITTYGLWLFNGGVGINGTATWGANNASITAAGVISGNGSGITGLNSNNFSGQINLSQINPAPVGGGLTNNGNGYTLGQTSSNPSTNAPITFTDIPYQTNIYLTANNAGAALVNAATTSYGVILAIGDSMSEGQYGIPSSASFQLGQIYHNVYGDDGGGGYGTWEFGFNGGFYGRPDTSIWYGSVGPELYAGDGTNAADSRQGAWAAPTNFVNQIAVSWVSWPRGSNFVVRISSLSSSYTNFYTLSSLAGTTNFNVTNLPASGNDNLVQFSALAGSNVICDVSFLGTNLGVQYWCEARGGVTLDNMLAVGTNALAKMYNQINPNELIYHAKDFGEQPDAMTLSNKLVQVLQFVPTNCLVSLVGTPPILENSYRDNNFVLKQCCITHGWYYLDLWDSFSDFNSMTNSGLMADGTHPNTLGATVWASKLYTLNNGLPATIPAANPPPGKYGAAIYNWSASSSGYALNYNGTGKLFLNQNALNFNDQFGRLSVDFSASGGIDVWNNLGIQLWGGGYIFSIFGALTLKSQSGIIFDPYNLGGGGVGGFAAGNGTTNLYLNQGTVFYGNVSGATNWAITPFYTNTTTITLDKITGALSVGTNNFGGSGSGSGFSTNYTGVLSLTNMANQFAGTVTATNGNSISAPAGNVASSMIDFRTNGATVSMLNTNGLLRFSTNTDGSGNVAVGVIGTQNAGLYFLADGETAFAWNGVQSASFVNGMFQGNLAGGTNINLNTATGTLPFGSLPISAVTNATNGRIPAANIGQLSVTNLPGAALTNNNAADVTLTGALTVTSTETLNGAAQLANNYANNILKLGPEEYDGFWLSTSGWRHNSTYIDTWTASASPTFNTAPEMGWKRESVNVMALASYTNTTSSSAGYASLKVATLTATNVTVLGNLSAATNLAAWNAPINSTTLTITNSPSGGKAMWYFSLKLTDAATGNPSFQVQIPGMFTNIIFPTVPLLTVATYTNDYGPYPVQPGFTNSIVDTSGTGASVSVVGSRIVY